MPLSFFLSDTTSLAKALDLRPGDVVSIVGGGGKTSLMFRLAHELAADGRSVITTTTTRIIPPAPEESECLVLEDDEDRLITRAREALKVYRHITLARSRPNADKLIGLLPTTVDSLHNLEIADYIVNEADGAASRPLKAPNPTEPVFPSNTSLTVAMVGIEAVGRRLVSENVFRVEHVSRLTGLTEGELVTMEAVSLLLTHPQGIIQYAPAGRIIPFINKAGEGYAEMAKSLAAKILQLRHPQIERVVFGEVRRPDYPVTIVSHGTGKPG